MATKSSHSIGKNRIILSCVLCVFAAIALACVQPAGSDDPGAENWARAASITLAPGNLTLDYAITPSNPKADSYDVYWHTETGHTAAAIKSAGSKIIDAHSTGTLTGLIGAQDYSVVVTAIRAGSVDKDSVAAVGTVTAGGGAGSYTWASAPVAALTPGNGQLGYTLTPSDPPADSYDVY